jgi:mRNA-degrading endonuclease RelE of RelBE toxin-antitoxin system
MVTVNLALARTFLESFAKLPKKQQKKVREMTERFQDDPTRRGQNFEHIKQARDHKVRSVRIDQTYRMILVQPDRGDTLLCVWVDHHDEAYAWVKNRVFEVNPKSGVLQVYSVEEGQVLDEAPAPSPKATKTPHLFAAFDDEELLLAGVPIPLLSTVRALVHEIELDDLAPHLPEDACELLYLFAAGYSFLDALDETSRKPESKPVDVDDFEAALELPETQRLFHLVEGEAELEAILDAPLAKWRVFLHPSQRRLVEMNAQGPVRVLGGAGTGKTVVLMHRAKYLLESKFTAPEDRLLVTTYTKTLAEDLRKQLDELCGGHAQRIEVRHLHSWASQYYERLVGRRLRIASDKEQSEAMQSAMDEAGETDYSLSFFQEEWEQVVQLQDALTLEGYFKARRVGRGTRLGRKQRMQVWRVLERYREHLGLAKLTEWQDVIREVRLYLEDEDRKLSYRAVLADEVQDLTPNELRLLRAIVPKGPADMFLVGDAHQRIYGGVVRMGACGIEIRGRSKRLKLNYRTTDEIRTQAVAVLEGLDIDDLDGGSDSLKGYRSLRSGPVPELLHFDTSGEEEAAIIDHLKRWLEDIPPEEICLAARTNDLVKSRYAQLLTRAGIEFTLLSTGHTSGKGVRLATMHRLKGLEFRRVILASVQDGEMPKKLPQGSHADKASIEDHEKRERCLLYVAATRARDQLMITGYGKRSGLLS